MIAVIASRIEGAQIGTDCRSLRLRLGFSGHPESPLDTANVVCCKEEQSHLYKFLQNFQGLPCTYESIAFARESLHESRLFSIIAELLATWLLPYSGSGRNPRMCP